MSNQNITIELNLDCEGGDRLLILLLQGKELKITLLERDADENGKRPEKWEGATGILESKDCLEAVEQLEEWIQEHDPAPMGIEECLTLVLDKCFYAWRRREGDEIRYQYRSGVDRVHVYLESLGDLRYLTATLKEFHLRMEGRFPTR